MSPTAAPAVAPAIAATVASTAAPAVAPRPSFLSNTAPAAPVITPTTGIVPPAGAGIPIFQCPSPTGLPASLPPATPLGSAVAFAWNNLGMHCYQIDYSLFLILPPYNVFWTQVVSRWWGRPIHYHQRADGSIQRSTGDPTRRAHQLLGICACPTAGTSSRASV